MATPFGAGAGEQKRPLGPRPQRRRVATPYDDIKIDTEAPALNQINQREAFGNLVGPPTDANDNVLNDNMNNPLTRAFYGSGRTRQKFTSGQSGVQHLPLIGAFYAAVLERLPQRDLLIPGTNQQYPPLAQSDSLFVTVDNVTGALPDELGTQAQQNAIASGQEIGMGHIKGTGRGYQKVGGQAFKNALKKGIWSPEQERNAVAFAMYLGGPALAKNLSDAGYRIGHDGTYVRGNASQIRTDLAAKSGNKRRLGSYAFAMRANQQHNYFEQGDDAATFANALQRNRNANGFANPGSFLMKRELLARGRGGRARSGAVFVPRDSQGQPLANITQGGDMNDPRYQCRVENSGPGISDFTDNDGQPSAGFRLFRRANQKTGTVTCGYTPDIFVNTVTQSYNGNAQEGQKNRVMAGNNLAAELQRRGAAAAGVAGRLQQGYNALNADRSQFYGRSLKRKPAVQDQTLSQQQNEDGSALSPQQKVAAWQNVGL